MGTSNKERRNAKNRKKLLKRNASPNKRINPKGKTSDTLFQFTHNWKAGASGAYEFPGRFRDIVCRELPTSLEVSSDLSGIQIELVWYDSIQDRALGRNPFITILCNVESAHYLTSKSKFSGWQNLSGYEYWNLGLELVELIEKGTLYGEWYNYQGNKPEGFNTEKLDLILGILRDSIEKFRLTGKIPSKIMDEKDTFWVRSCSFSEESRDRIGEISAIQVDAVLFFIKALALIIPALSSSKPPFIGSQAAVKDRIKLLNSAEGKLIDQHKSVVFQIRGLKCQIDSLIELNFKDDRKVKEYHATAKQIANLKEKRLSTLGFINELTKLENQLESGLITLKDSIKEVLKEENSEGKQEKFKRLTLSIHETEDQLKNARLELASQTESSNKIEREIPPKESRCRILESELQIDDLVSKLRELRDLEISLMTDLDRLFVERMIALLPYNIWARRHNSAVIEA
ncbi:MAG TPA: hypothetical protein PKA63_10235 [Oligoflexia bacterium]|nr:hypothetical protein [Oligoflexia bacterium]HMP49035.1 hypothetical protein [Oligoflexia bacterium]